MVTPVPPFRPHAVVFDLDGVLVDSEGLWSQAESRVVESLGGAWHPDVGERMLGLGPADAAAVLAEHLEHPDPEEVEERLLTVALELFTAGVRPRDGAGALLAALRGQVPVGVATNSRRMLAEASLSSAGLAGSIDALVTADEARAAKPDPAPYLLACETLEVAPTATVVFEDSPVGAQAARSAGCWVIGCPEEITSALPAAHVVVADLAAIDVAVLLDGEPHRAPRADALGSP